MENEPCFQIPKAWHYEKTDRARQGNRRERQRLCKYILNITTNNLVAILNAIKKALTTALVREWGVASETWRTGEKITCHDKSINHKRCGACEKEKSARSHTPTNWFLAVSSVSSTNNRTPKQAIHVCNHNNNNANSNELWRLSANYTQQCHPNIRYAEREQESVLRTAWALYTLYDDELHDFFPFVFIGIWEEIIVIDATHKKKTKRQGSGEKNEQNRKRNEIPTIKKHTNRL